MSGGFQYRERISFYNTIESVLICEICVTFVSAYKRRNGTQIEGMAQMG